MNPGPSSPYDSAIESLEAQIRYLQSVLDSLKILRSGPDGTPLVFSSGGSRDAETDVRHDTFFGMTIGDAAKKYLTMVKATKSTSEIAEALERGGLKHSSKDFPTTVRSILGPREDFTRTPNGDWGISEWYPRAKKAKPEKPKKTAKSKTKKKIATKAASAPAPTKNSESATAAATPFAPMAEALAQGGPQARIEAYRLDHPQAESREIAEKLGIKIQTVALILGKLKKKAAA